MFTIIEITLQLKSVTASRKYMFIVNFKNYFKIEVLNSENGLSAFYMH